jgi:hypothetical protein
LLILGCSGKSTTPVSPASESNDLPCLTAPNPDDIAGHELMGYWSVSFDPETLEATVEPQRHPTAHIKASELLPAPEFDVTLFDPANGIVGVEITITNPYPVNAYDLRGILFTDEKRHKLLNPDGWTPLFDIEGGGFINPFKAFAKDESNRIFAGPIQHTEYYEIYFPGALYVPDFGIDASFPDNCNEPYSIENFTQNVLFDEIGSDAMVEVDVLDWQDDCDQVIMMAPNITGEPFTYFSHQGDNTWEMLMTNGAGIEPGTYDVLIIATSTNSASLALYDYVEVVITPKALYVYEIEGPDEVNESACEEYYVVAEGDTGITYQWTCDPPSVGYFTEPNSATTDFCANPLDYNIPTTLQVEVNSDGGGPIFRTKPIVALNAGIGWPAAFGGGEIDQGYDVAVDSYGYVYATGRFKGMVDFNPDPELEWIRYAISKYDAFVCKFDWAGNLIWAQTWGTANDDIGLDITIDNVNCVYMCGVTREDGFISKYLPDGEESWALKWDAREHYADINPLIVNYDSSDIIYILGTFSGSNAIDFDPGLGEDFHSAESFTDIYITKMDLSGNYLWTKTKSGGKYDQVNHVEIDDIGDIYLTGYWDYREHYDDDTEAYLISYDPNGNLGMALAWSNPTGWNEGRGLFIDENHNFYVTGYFNATTDFDPDPVDIDSRNSIGGNDVFLSKFDSTGDFQWVRTWGGSGHDYGDDVIIADNNYVFVFGTFKEMVDMDPGVGTDYQFSNGGSDVYINTLDQDGIQQFSVAWGETQDDFYSGFAWYSPHFYLTGYFTGTVDFDPCGVEERTSNGADDVFVTKMGLDGCLVRD